MNDQEIGELKADVKHILAGVEEIKSSVKALEDGHNRHSYRITKIETSHSTTAANIAMFLAVAAIVLEVTSKLWK